MIDIIHADCLDAMRAMPAASVDAVVTDPPYLNVGTGNSRVSKTRGVPDERQFFDLWMREIWREWSRILKPTGAAWLTIDWRGAVSCESASLGTPLKFGGVGVWDRGGLGMGFMVRHTYECFALGRMPEWQRVLTNEPDVWRHEWFPGSRKHGHEAEKPVDLFKRAIRLLGVPPGGVVLDPFAGSGTTGIAARAEGMRAILVEREAEFVEIIQRRTAA